MVLLHRGRDQAVTYGVPGPEGMGRDVYHMTRIRRDKKLACKQSSYQQGAAAVGELGVQRLSSFGGRRP